jgi:cleavage and polyadenylation specificity factor subunit 2
MVDGKLAFESGSTVPMLEAGYVDLPPAVEVKEEAEGEGKDAEQPEEVVADGDGDVVMEGDKPEAEGQAEESEGAAVKSEPEAEVVKEEPAEPEHTAEPEAEAARTPTPTPALNTAPARLPSSLFIGDLRLLHLKNRLASLSIPAEFAGEGMLVCGPGVAARTRGGADDKSGGGGGAIVAVRKLGQGQVVLEGAISATYFAVRKELYGSYAQVTTV